MGNFEIQAKIDIERHPEWDTQKKLEHLYRMKIKDMVVLKHKSIKKSDIFNIIEEYLDDVLPLSWQNGFNPYFTPSFEIDREERPWQRGLRAQTIVYDEPHWYDCRPIISPNVFRTEVLGDVRI